MVDQTGAPLNDQYYAFFLINTLPYLPQNVYQDPFGDIVWSNPIQFLPNGTLPDNIYFDNTLVYRIEIRKGPTQSFPLNGNPIENYAPGNPSSTTSSDALLTAENLITNPQFSDIYFTSPYIFTQGSSGTYTVPIGPGWNLILTGAGTTTISQTSISGSGYPTNVPYSPYFLTIANSGWTSVILQQRFSNNGAIFSNGAIAISFLAFSNGSAQPLSVNYVDSNGTTINPPLFPTTSILTGSFNAYNNAVNVSSSTNPTTGANAFVNINFVLPPSGTMTLTNIQLTGQSVPLPGDFSNSSIQPFEEITYERTVDQEFHVYKNSILIRPKSSILTGWSFDLNPFQFNTTTVTTVAPLTSYIADQTILHQTAGSQLQSGSAAPIERFGLQIQPVVGATQTRLALIQYIDPSTVLPYWGGILSSLVRMAMVSNVSSTVRIKMRLIWSTALPGTIGNTEPIASWPANSDPVMSNNWVAVSPINDPIYTLPSGNYFNYAFNGFQLPPNTSSGETMTLGIMIYTMDNMSATAPVDYVIFDKISLVPNEFAIDANPETFDQVLRQCQYYYEKSYDYFTLPGTASNSSGALSKIQQVIADPVGNVMYLNPSILEISFKSVKRAAPLMKIYNIAGTVNSSAWFYYTSGSVTQSGNAVFSSNWSSLETSTSNATYKGIGASLLTPPPFSGNSYGFAQFHYSANACLGSPTLP